MFKSILITKNNKCNAIYIHEIQDFFVAPITSNNQMTFLN